MTRKPAKSRETNSRSSPNGKGSIDNISYVPTRKVDHLPGEPHGYSLRSLTPAYWPSVDFSDVAALSNSKAAFTRATFFACDFLIKMDLAKLHLLNDGFDHDNWNLTDENNCLSWFHTNIIMIENFRRKSVLR